MESELKVATRELASQKEVMFKQSQELFRSVRKKLAEISGAQAALKNLNAKIRKLDEQSVRQQELVYNGEFQIQQLERKVSRASEYAQTKKRLFSMKN